MAKTGAAAMAQLEGEYYYGVGRRKTSSAQVRVYPTGADTVIVNGKPMDDYFPRLRDQLAVKAPLESAGVSGYTVTCLALGGGSSGQSGAIMQGIARALVQADESLRTTFRAGGFLTRDPRAKERKKPGLKRARKAPQYTKR